MKALHIISFILLIVGGLAWGISGLGGPMIVGYLGATLAKIVYILVGLAALFELFTHWSHCKYCAKSSMPSASM